MVNNGEVKEHVLIKQGKINFARKPGFYFISVVLISFKTSSQKPWFFESIVPAIVAIFDRS